MKMNLLLMMLGTAGLCGAYFTGQANAISLRNPRKAVYTHQVRTRFAKMDLSILGAEDEGDSCVVLPHAPYPGPSPEAVGGAMCLLENEDSTSTNTQIFLKDNGCVELGETDGPPPESFCGLWQCGAESFQMTITRTFSTNPSTLDASQSGQMTGQLSYSVTRAYFGNINPKSSSGVEIVQGRMQLYSDDLYSDQSERENPNSSEFAASAPIGYFSLDGDVGKELKSSD